VPVGGADTIAIQFTENVLQVRPDSLQLVGLFFGSALPALLPGAEGFAYDDASRTATWSFASPLPADQYYLSLQESVLDSDGNALDGEWSNPFSVETTNALVSQFPSGNGEPGGDFNFVFTILPGDATRDNRITWGDLQRYITFLGASQQAFEQSDYDGDGQVTEADLAIWEARFGTILRSLAFADFNQDYQVDVRDAGILVTNFGAGTGAQHALGDSDADGDVDGTDLLRLSRQWGLRLHWLT
jgi:hypothetical protein